jgi:hypothetical protein
MSAGKPDLRNVTNQVQRPASSRKKICEKFSLRERCVSPLADSPENVVENRVTGWFAEPFSPNSTPLANRPQLTPPQRLAMRRKMTVDAAEKVVKLIPHARMLWFHRRPPLHIGAAGFASTIPPRRGVCRVFYRPFGLEQPYNSLARCRNVYGISIR